MEPRELTLRIIGEDLTDIDFGDRSKGDGRSRLFLGIQKGREAVDLVSVTRPTAVFTAHLRVSPLPDDSGGTNFLGPYAHGTRAARFCYLCWLAQDDSGAVRMFSRIKLPLSPLLWESVAAARAEQPLVLRFSLRGKGGGPICASVPRDALRWSIP